MKLIRAAVAEAADHQERFAATDTEARKIVEVMEDFLRVKGRVVYGGAAINAHMPAEHKFYDPTVNLPDYDFLTPDPLQDCADLIVSFQEEGFTDVEAKFGIHEGTYKVFVNFRAAADITFIPEELFSRLATDSVLLEGIRYASPDYLRMNMYLELSRPAGDISRWEKIYKRLLLLNEFHPPRTGKGKCVTDPLQTLSKSGGVNPKLHKQIMQIGIEEGIVFLSGAEEYLSFRTNPIKKEKEREKGIILMVASPQSLTSLSKSLTALRLKETLIPAVGELLPRRREYYSGKGTLVAVVFETVACHAYTVIRKEENHEEKNTDEEKEKEKESENEIPSGYRLASLDFLIQMYYAFLFAGLEYLLPVRILCVIQALIEIESERRKTASAKIEENEESVIDVFPLDCVGHQPTLPELKKVHRERVKEKRNELMGALRAESGVFVRRGTFKKSKQIKQ